MVQVASARFGRCQNQHVAPLMRTQMRKNSGFAELLKKHAVK